MYFFIFIILNLISLSPKNNLNSGYDLLNEITSNLNTQKVKPKASLSFSSFMKETDNTQLEQVVEDVFKRLSKTFSEEIDKANQKKDSGTIALKEYVKTPMISVPIANLNFNCRILKYDALTQRMVIQIDDSVIVRYEESEQSHIQYFSKQASKFKGHPFLALPQNKLSIKDKEYLIFPYVQGQHLNDISLDSLSVKEQKKIFLSLLLGMEEVSSKGLFHNDLHFENIIISEDKKAHIIDLEHMDMDTRVSPVHMSEGFEFNYLNHSDWARMEYMIFLVKSDWMKEFSDKFSLDTNRLSQYLFGQSFISMDTFFKMTQEPLYEEDLNPKHLNKTLRRMILWEGFDDIFPSVVSDLPKDQIKRLQPSMWSLFLKKKAYTNILMRGQNNTKIEKSQPIKATPPLFRGEPHFKTSLPFNFTLKNTKREKKLSLKSNIDPEDINPSLNETSNHFCQRPSSLTLNSDTSISYSA